MSDRIAVMHARPGRAARHPRGALRPPDDAVRGRLHRHDQPAHRRGRGGRPGRGARPARWWRACLVGGSRARRRADGRAVDPPGVDPARRRPNGDAHDGPEPLHGTVEQVAYLGGNVQYQVRTRGGLAITAVLPQDRRAPARRSDVDVVWPAGGGTRPRRTSRTTRRRLRHDPSIRRLVDRPRARARPLHGRAQDQPPPAARADGGRRRDRGARAGRRRLHAAAAHRRSPAAPASRCRRRQPRRRRPAQRRRRSRRPRASCSSTTTPSTWPGDHQAVRGRSTGSRSPRLTSSRTTSCTRGSWPATRGFDLTFPTRYRRPRARDRGRSWSARPVADPERQEPRGRVGRPRLRPGQQHSMPYMWWTTGFAYDTEKVDEELTSLEALWDPQYRPAPDDARRPARGVRGGADPAGLERQHRPTTPSSTRRWPC